MEPIVFEGSTLKNHVVDEKSGGYILSFDIPETESESLAELIRYRKFSFQLVLVPSDTLGEEDSVS